MSTPVIEHTQDLSGHRNGTLYHVFPPPLPPEPPRRRHGAALYVSLTLLAVLLVAGIAVGAFFVGQGTRRSDSAVKHEIDKQAALDKAFYAKKEHAALHDQSKKLHALMRKRARKAFAKGKEQGYSAGQAAGYSSGQAVGYSSGQSDGIEAGKEQGERTGRRQGRVEGAIEGYSEGFDDGTCFTTDYEYVC